jgi:hypothetical protein
MASVDTAIFSPFFIKVTACFMESISYNPTAAHADQLLDLIKSCGGANYVSEM